jgi:hypothetical protein
MGRTRKDTGEAAGRWTREAVKRYLLHRFYTRFHMSLILSSSGLAAMLASWVMLKAGLTSMLARYPVAIAAAYLTFLAGVWVWLRYVGMGERAGTARSLLENADIPDLRLGGGSGGSGAGSVGSLGKGGGSFDGGGASASWAEARAPVLPSSVQTRAFAVAAAQDAPGGDAGLEAPVIARGAGGGSGKGGGIDGLDLGDLDGEAIVLLVLALAAIAAIFVASGYLVWFAPDILSEAAFGAALAGGLSRRSKREDAEGWVSGIVKKTWWPFAIVLVAAMAFAGYATKHYPAAHTFREAVAAALAS